MQIYYDKRLDETFVLGDYRIWLVIKDDLVKLPEDVAICNLSDWDIASYQQSYANGWRGEA